MAVLIRDVVRPVYRMSGLGLQQELKRRGKEIPIIFITARKTKTSGSKRSDKEP